MSIRIGINGFGRIGRNVFRACYKDPDIEIVAEAGDGEEAARGLNGAYGLDDYSDVDLEVGGSTNNYNDDQRGVGNAYRVDSPTILKSYSQYLYVPDWGSLYFALYEGDTIGGIHEKIWERNVWVMEGGTVANARDDGG